MEPKSCEFEVTSAKPVSLRVQHEGKSYVVKVGITVLDVRTKGDLNPLNNLPNFEVGAGLSVSVFEE